MKKTSQSGIAHLGLLLLVLVVAVISFVGYKLEQSRNNSPTASTTNVAQAAQTIPAINSKADLNTAETTLNSQNIDGDLNPSSFDQEVSALQ